MYKYKTIKSLRNKIKDVKSKGKTVGFVPTMGALHEGHLSLIRRAKKETDFVVVSIFVNPIQFCPGEDLKKYPVNLNKDLKLCGLNGADVVFCPDAKVMFGNNFFTYVDVRNITEGLCGASRPGHFRGVATIVAKLFNITAPDKAYFGRKDAQQAAVIRKMSEDLNIPVKINVMPIVREKDGLAMSSRNVYLSPEERKKALCLYGALKTAKEFRAKGEADPKNIIAAMRKIILREKGAEIEYVSIVDKETLKSVKRISGKVMAAAAVRIGAVRLIDNVII
jgi:pantoate--beta-alanine ligase